MTVPAIFGNQKTMSSREIAELTDKQHQHVKRDIEKMLAELGEDVSKVGRIYLDSMNREQTEYHLSRDLTDCLLTGYSAIARMKVIKRWKDLEQQAATGFKLPATMAEALRLAADQAEQIEAQGALLAIASPKAQALDRIATLADGSMCITNAAKVLGHQPKVLFAWLQEHDWIYRRPGSAHWVGYQPRIKSGYLDHKLTTITKSDGTERVTEQVLVTAKGMTKLAQDMEVA